MSNEIALFEGQTQLPAHLQAIGDGEANIESG